MFASPEQIQEVRVDRRSDIYSLGMTLWFLVLGRGPLTRADGESVTEQQAIPFHVGKDEHESRFSPDWNPEFRALLSKMVRKNPDERFGSAGEVIAAVQEVLNQLPERGATVVPEPEASPMLQQMRGAWGGEPDVSIIAGEAGETSALGPTRPLGLGSARVYTANWNPTGEKVTVTAWAATGGLDDAREKDFGEYLCGLGEAASRSQQPPEIIPVRAVYRTQDQWWVVESWQGGEPLDSFWPRLAIT
jgi:hypothetical protein